MAAVFSLFRSAGWPFTNTLALALTPAAPKNVSGTDERFRGTPVAPLSTHIAVFAGCVPRLLLAILCLAYMADKASMATLAASWIVPIFLRDLAVTIATAGLWDTLLYSTYSPLRERAHTLKFDPKYPPAKQLAHDIFWSLVSTLISSVFEVAVLHAWARGALALHAPVAWWADAATLLWVVGMPYPRLAHFFVVHRAMHKWQTTSIPDVGAWLYKHVHSLHHKSRNPTSWSGVSMHPVESTLYYTAMLVPALLGAHPLIILYTKFDLTCAALIGHDGFGEPSTGSHDHWLHHALVTCNYGESFVPLDYIFGTYAGSEADYERRFGGSKAAAAAAAKDE